MAKIYMAALLGYIPLIPQLVQEEILPVVRPRCCKIQARHV